eukprot:9479516-Alexandrium_andersonii.AAC.1
MVEGAYDIDGLWLSSGFDPAAEASIPGPPALPRRTTPPSSPWRSRRPSQRCPWLRDSPGPPPLARRRS